MVTIFLKINIDIIVENPRSVALRLPQTGKKKSETDRPWVSDDA